MWGKCEFFKICFKVRFAISIQPKKIVNCIENFRRLFITLQSEGFSEKTIQIQLKNFFHALISDKMKYYKRNKWVVGTIWDFKVVQLSNPTCGFSSNLKVIRINVLILQTKNFVLKKSRSPPQQRSFLSPPGWSFGYKSLGQESCANTKRHVLLARPRNEYFSRGKANLAESASTHTCTP